MTASSRPTSPKANSIAQWDALLARYPLGSPLELARQLAVVGIGNAVVVRMVVTGQLAPWELVLLVGLEAFLLTAVAWAQARMVPRSALMDEPVPLAQRLGTLGFGLFWLAAVYTIILGVYLREGRELLDALAAPWETLRRSAVRWPLAISVVAAAADAVADWRHWRARGGYFLSTPGFNAGARWLTLFFGGIPFFVPMAALAWTVVTFVQRLVRDPRSPLTLVVIPLLALAVFGPLAWMLRAGVLAWAVGYTSAKLVSEGFILCLPLIARRARDEEAAA